MDIWLIFAAFMLLAPVARLWPIVRQDPNKRGARNNPLWIVIYPNDGSLQWRAVLAGEKVQFYTRWLGAVLLTAPVAWLLPWPAACFLTFAGTLWTVPFYRLNEYGGKVAYSLVRGLPVDSEAELLTGYPEFAGMSVEEVARNLRRAAPLARALVRVLGL